MSTAIELKSLTKTFERHRTFFNAVDNISLTANTGSILGFLGPNGAGKTTTIKMICGLIEPTKGSININGFNKQDNRAAYMNQIGVVMEGSRNIYWQLTVWENLLYYARLKGCFNKSIMAQRAEKLLHDLLLWDQKDICVGNLSRGMQQKTAIACALISDPPVLLLDEPTLGLDINSTQAVKDLIIKVAHCLNKTVILTTHQLAIAQELCTQIAIIDHGKLIANKPIHELLHLFHKEHYLITIYGNCKDAFQHYEDLIIQYDGKKTILLLSMHHQKTLHELLQIISSSKLLLESVIKTQDSLEEIFIHLVKR